MGNIHPNRAGLILALLFGGVHLIWSFIVALGWARVIIDFILRLHFIKLNYTLDTFNLGNALFLIAVTTAIGYVVGWGFAVLWNQLHR